MFLVSVTRLRLRKWRYLPAFAYFTLLSFRQSRRTTGNLATSIARDRGLVFWTVTVWSDAASMRAFRNHGPHQRAMPMLRRWCDEATYVHFEQPGSELPELAAAYEKLKSDGIVSRVDHPSPQHATRNFAAPR